MFDRKMLGSRTKQVNSYGRRGHRIVNISEKRDINNKFLEHGSSKHAFSSASTDMLADDSNSDNDSILVVPTSPQIRRIRKRIPRMTSPESTPEPTPRIDKQIPIVKKAKRSPKIAKSGKVDVVMPDRQPLSSVHTNTPKSSTAIPNVRKKKKSNSSHAPSLIPVSPVIGLDIVVLDAKGRRISQERRVSRSNVHVNRLADSFIPPIPKRGKGSAEDNVAKVASSDQDVYASVCPHKPVGRATTVGSSSNKVMVKVTEPVTIVLSDSDDDEMLSPRRPRKRVEQARSVIISDDESLEGVVVPFSNAPGPPLVKPKYLGDLGASHPPSRKTSTSQNSGNRISVIPTTPRAPHSRPSYSTTPALVSPELHRSRPRQLTPLRGRGAAFFPAPPSPPSPTTPTDFDDLTFDFSNLNISPSTVDQGVHGSTPAYLVPLLEDCEQSTPHEFSAFIEMFPFDPIVRTSGQGATSFQKIGEASYSEVFGIGDVVLKVIPLYDEDNPRKSSWASKNDSESPYTSHAKDVLKEMVVTRAMGEMCEGFVQLLRSYIVRGKYPSLLLDLWDEYNEKKGSESIRPGELCTLHCTIRIRHTDVDTDSFTVSQLYAIIVLPNGGPDLETYVFSSPSKSGWKQACSIFWQVARTLAEAEDLVCFEVRNDQHACHDYVDF